MRAKSWNPARRRVAGDADSRHAGFLTGESGEQIASFRLSDSKCCHMASLSDLLSVGTPVTLELG